MQSALGVGAAVAPEPEPEMVDPDAGNGVDETLENFLDPSNIPTVEGEIPGVGRVRLRNGELDFQPGGPNDPERGPPRRRRDRIDDRAPPPRDPSDEE